jgi:Uma2 family endonuclease
MDSRDAYRELTVVPRAALRLPLVLEAPEGFEVDDPKSWPAVEGRLEYVGGRIEYMPPCGGDQQRTTADVLAVLGAWRRDHPEFIVGGNEAGMLLAGEVRAADAAAWHRADVAPGSAFPRSAPILAVEVAGRDDDMSHLSEKAQWYLSRGVTVVWLLDPAERRVCIVTNEATLELGANDRIPPHPALPDLTPSVHELFAQVNDLTAP